VVLRSKSKNHIDLEVLETGSDKWRFTGIYGEPQSDLKYKTWERMEWLKDQDNEQLPWLYVGDFNEILFHHEKEGGSRSQSCLDLFKGALEVYELDDLGFSGDIFTWRNKQTIGNTHIRERLDWAVANAGWRMKFPLMHVKNGDPYHSDHRTVVVLTETLPQRKGSGGGFNFEASWIQAEGCPKVIEEAWESSSGADCSLRESIRGMAASLKDWSVNVLGDLEKRLKKAKKELEKWRRESISDDSVRREAVWSFKVDRLEELVAIWRSQHNLFS